MNVIEKLKCLIFCTGERDYLKLCYNLNNNEDIYKILLNSPINIDFKTLNVIFNKFDYNIIIGTSSEKIYKDKYIILIYDSDEIYVTFTAILFYENLLHINNDRTVMTKKPKDFKICNKKFRVE